MHIREVKVNAAGDVTDVMINGNTYGMKEAVKMAKAGELEGVTISQKDNGEAYISSFSNGMLLQDLPKFQ